MSDDIGLEVSPRCPKCGSQLMIEQLGAEPHAEDKISCTACSFTCDHHTFHNEHFDINAPEVRDRVREEADKLVGEMLKGLGLK